MSNLIPNPRTDKNGRTVTRWVRIPELKKRKNTTRSLIESIWENEANVLDRGVL